MLCELVDHVQNIRTQNTFPLYQLRVDQLKVNNLLFHYFAYSLYKNAFVIIELDATPS